MNYNQIRDIISIFIGSCFVLLVSIDYVLIFLSRKWKPIKGKVLEAEIESDGFLSGEYSYNIKYFYIVDGKEYYSTIIYASEYYLGRFGGSIWFVKKMMKGIRQGDEILVYYNPRNPKIACVKTEPEYSFFALFVLIGLLFLILGLLSYMGYIKINNVWP